MTLSANFLAKTRKTDCTVWIGATNSKGYGIVQADGRRHLAHRLAYEDAYGPIPAGSYPDHVCRVRNCVNPQHLELVSAGENVRRGHLAIGGICTNGHQITEGSVYTRSNGKTECRECRRIGCLENSTGGARPTKTRRATQVAADCRLSEPAQSY